MLLGDVPVCMEMSLCTTVLTNTHPLYLSHTHTHAHSRTNGLWCALIGWKAGKGPVLPRHPSSWLCAMPH